MSGNWIRVVEMFIREVVGGISVEVDGQLSDAEQEVACKVEWMPGLEQDFPAFYALAREEPKLAHVEERAYDFVPVDSWALKMVSHEWYGGKPVGRTEVEAAFEHWGEWQGLAYWFWDWSYASEA